MLILADKYRTLEPGRIPLPKNAQQLWAQHKYSVMARDISTYQSMGRWVTSRAGAKAIDAVALELNTLLRQPPSPKLIENTLLHMWGYVSGFAPFSEKQALAMPADKLLTSIQQLALAHGISYLIESTAIGELNAWQL